MSLAMPGVDPRLADIVGAAANDLGYDVRAVSGREGRTNPASFHSRGLAQDFQIYDPQGNPIPNRGDDPTGMYARLANQAFIRQQQMHPELNGKLAWGGAFGTQIGGGGPPDLMHFDLGGERGTAYPQFRQQALAARFGGGAPVAQAQQLPGTLTDLIAQTANKMGRPDLIPIMNGIRAGESKHTANYDVKDDNVESSWGPFQLNRHGGLGNQFEKDTGLSLVNNPASIPAQVQWVANYLAKGGSTGAWMGYRGPVAQADPNWGNSGYDPKNSAGSGTAYAGGGSYADQGAPRPPAYPMMTPAQSIGQQLANIAYSPGFSGGGATEMPTASDQPAPRMPALSLDFSNVPNPLPPQFRQGTSVPETLGTLSAQSPATNPLDASGMSITGGAPSMTAMLPTVGTPDTWKGYDPRAMTTARSPKFG